MDPTQGQDLPQRPTNLPAWPTVPSDPSAMTRTEEANLVKNVRDAALPRMAMLAEGIRNVDESQQHQFREIEHLEKSVENLKRMDDESTIRSDKVFLEHMDSLDRIKKDIDEINGSYRQKNFETPQTWIEESSESEEMEPRLERRKRCCCFLECLCKIWEAIVKFLKC